MIQYTSRGTFLRFQKKKSKLSKISKKEGQKFFQIATSTLYISLDEFFRICHWQWQNVGRTFLSFSLFPFCSLFTALVYLIARRPSQVLYSLHAATFALKLLHPSPMRVSHRNPPEQMANTVCSRRKLTEKRAIVADNEQCFLSKVRDQWTPFAKFPEYPVRLVIGTERERATL